MIKAKAKQYMKTVEAEQQSKKCLGKPIGEEKKQQQQKYHQINTPSKRKCITLEGRSLASWYCLFQELKELRAGKRTLLKPGKFLEA